MPVRFLEVPDWFSFENQGAGVAVTDLDGNGRLDLLVLMVDNPVGPNQGLYKVGMNLDATGNPAGGWSDWISVPDWFSFENQGAGLAAADLDGNGRPDLIVFMIDNPVGQNQGLYRVGKNLDAGGRVTGGWSDWRAIPDWFSFENDGGSIAVADLTGNGRPDLLVFMIDAPVGLNQGLYQIGRDLDADGVVTGGWSGWKPVPEWFSDRNQGAGVAVAALSTPGPPDALFFHIDDAITQNQAFYKIARGIQGDGTIAGEWSPWYGVPGWFSWENQGGAIAVADLSGHGAHDLMVLMVDNPVGKNRGLFQVLPLDDDPATRGQWELLPYDSQVLAVHAAVLPGGPVLFFAGSGNSGVRFASPDFGDTTKGFWCSVVWDYTKSVESGQPQFFHPDTLRDTKGRPVDFFCGGETFLADGKLLAAGGTKAYDVDGQNRPAGHGFYGRPDALLFDPAARQWSAVAPMAHGRWYPTLIALGDGRVLAASGLDEDGALNGSLEIFTPDAHGGAWKVLNTLHLPAFLGLPLYAHLFQLEDGRVFFTGGRMDDARPTPPCLLDLTRNPVGIAPIAGLEASASRNQSASVLMPPAQAQKVLIMGGALALGEENATDSVDVIDLKDLSGPLPAYQRAAPLLLPRVHLNAVLLPDHTVFVSGGALQREGGAVRKIVARLQSEIYDPASDTWSLGAAARVERMYHSIALLLPDGRVVAASGNPDKGTQVPWEPPDPNEELRVEVYSPPYLFRGPRPTIDQAPAQCHYGQAITLHTPQAAQIRWVSLIRNGVTTHSFNTNQRLVDLEITSQAGNTIQATVPAEPNIAPPGFYMLFIVDQTGVPSEARWVQLS